MTFQRLFIVPLCIPAHSLYHNSRTWRRWLVALRGPGRRRGEQLPSLMTTTKRRRSLVLILFFLFSIKRSRRELSSVYKYFAGIKSRLCSLVGSKSGSERRKRGQTGEREKKEIESEKERKTKKKKSRSGSLFLSASASALLRSILKSTHRQKQTVAWPA